MVSTMEQSTQKKRKADALARRSLCRRADNAVDCHNGDNAVPISGRGSMVGWTTCPLCGRHSQKRYALGRGIATHLHAVHTPWNPGKVERKKRRRLLERQNLEQARSGQSLNETNETILNVSGWNPSPQEIEEWDEKVVKIVTDLEEQAQNLRDYTERTTGRLGLSVQLVKPGFDRDGKEAQVYHKSLPPFIEAAAQGDLDTLQRLVKEAKSAESLSQLLATRDRHLSTAEHWAAGGGHIECLRFLFEECSTQPNSETIQGSKIRRRDGKTCLHYAARNGHLICIRYLVEERGLQIDTPSGDGSTPFHLACFGGHLDVVQFFLKQCGESIATSSNEYGCSSAHWVAMTKSTDVAVVRRICNTLKEQGVSFTAIQKQGHSPLHKAAQVSSNSIDTFSSGSVHVLTTYPAAAQPSRN